MNTLMKYYSDNVQGRAKLYQSSLEAGDDAKASDTSCCRDFAPFVSIRKFSIPSMCASISFAPAKAFANDKSAIIKLNIIDNTFFISN